MPLYLRKGDITNMHCDAIVNATDIFLSGSGGVDESRKADVDRDFEERK